MFSSRPTTRKAGMHKELQLGAMACRGRPWLPAVQSNMLTAVKKSRCQAALKGSKVFLVSFFVDPWGLTERRHMNQGT